MLIAQLVTGERVAIDILNVRFGSKAVIRQFYFWNFFCQNWGKERGGST